MCEQCGFVRMVCDRSLFFRALFSVDVRVIYWLVYNTIFYLLDANDVDVVSILVPRAFSSPVFFRFCPRKPARGASWPPAGREKEALEPPPPPPTGSQTFFRLRHAVGCLFFAAFALRRAAGPSFHDSCVFANWRN